MWAVGKLELPFCVDIRNVDKQYFVLVVFQVMQGRKQLIYVIDVIKHIAEDNNERSFMDLFSDLVKHRRYTRFFAGVILLEKLLKLNKQLIEVRGSRFDLALVFYVF